MPYRPRFGSVWRLAAIGLLAILVTALIPAPAMAAVQSRAAFHGMASAAALQGRVPSHDVPSAALQGRVALIGVPGLEWSDLDESRTPNLWKLAGQGSTGSLSTRAVPPAGRGVTCPVAGWLTVSAGQRAGTPGPGCPENPVFQGDDRSVTVPGWAELVAHQADTGYDARLGTLAQTVIDGGGKVAAVGPGAAPAAADRSGRVAAYADTPAGLGDLSPYALIVMAAPDLATAWAAQPVDEYGVPAAMPPAVRQQAAAAADRRIGEFLAALPSGTTVLVAGISDVSPGAHLHVAIATGDRYPAGHLTASSTRQDALVAIQDVTATAIHLTGLEPPRQVVGRPWQPGGPAAATVHGTVADLADADLASQVLREVRGPFFAVFVAVQLLFYAFAALALRRRRARPAKPLTGTEDTRAGSATAENTRAESAGSATAGDTRAADAARGETPSDGAGAAAKGSARRAVQAAGDTPPDRVEAVAAEATPHAAGAGGARKAHNGAEATGTRNGHYGAEITGLDVAAASRLLVTVQIVSVVSGAIAVSTFLAQLVPWWSLPAPMAALIVTILGMAGLITGLAFAGPWRSHVLGPLTVVALVTSVAMLVDVMTGSSLQVNAVSGYEPVTGGRFYGFSNIAFAIYATGTVLALAGVAQWLRGRGAPRAAVMAVCVAYGGLAVFANGWPAWGADFGGVPAFVAGLAVFLILLSGGRVSVVKLLVIGLAGAALIAAISIADWLRPARQRTHLGTFVQQVIDGQAWTVVGRKFGAMIGVTVGNWSLTLLSLVALAFLFLVLARPSRWGASALNQAYALAPTFRAGLIGGLTCAFVGFLMNDSGIAIPAMALTVAVPLTLASCVRALQLATPTTAAPPSAPAGATERPGSARRS